MKRNKCKDQAGVTEMSKDGSSNLLQSILDVYNDVLSGRQEPPSSWKSMKLVVIFNKNEFQDNFTTMHEKEQKNNSVHMLNLASVYAVLGMTMYPLLYVGWVAEGNIFLHYLSPLGARARCMSS